MLKSRDVDAFGASVVFKCTSCQREVQMQENIAAFTLTVEIKPKNLQELFAGVAGTKGELVSDMLQRYGLSRGQAMQMAGGRALYPGAAVKFVEDLSITPSQFMALMKGQASVNAKRGPRKSKP